jgi:hypothetical protein
MEKVSAHQIREMLAENIDGLSKVEMSNIGLEVFPRLMERLSSQDGCRQCESYFNSLMVYASDVRLIFKGSADEQKRFLKLTDEAMKHLKSTHGIIPVGHTRSLYMFVASVVGLVAGWLIFAVMLQMGDPLRSAILGWIVLVLPAWVIGNIKEKQLKKNGKSF